VANSLLTKEADAALKLVEDSQGFHDDLVNKVEKRWKAFEGVLERSSKAAEWMSQLHPPHLNHIVETTIAGPDGRPVRVPRHSGAQVLQRW
jgi:hypothetical protein